MVEKGKTVTATEEEVGGDPVDEEKADRKAEEAKEPAVIYVGSAPVRIVSRADFEKAGVTDQDTATWNRRNGHSVKKSNFSDAALDVMLQDPTFKVVGE